MSNNVLGLRIKELRMASKLSQIQLASKLNIANTTLSQYESGKRIPSDDIKLRIANLFGVSIDYLLGNTVQDISTLNVITTSSNSELSQKEKKDIAKDLEKFKKELLESDELMFDGYPMSEDSINNILAALEIGMEQVRRKNKIKYSPKKFKNK